MVQRKYKYLPFIWFDDTLIFERWYKTIDEAKERELWWNKKYKKISKIIN